MADADRFERCLLPREMGSDTGFTFRGACEGFAETYVFHIQDETQIECAAESPLLARLTERRPLVTSPIYMASGRRGLHILYPILGV